MHSAVADTFFCGRTQRRTQQRCNPKQTNMECKLLSLGNMLTVRVDGKISQCASNAGMLWGHRLMRSELPAKPTKRRAGRKDWPILHAILCRLDQRIYDNRMEMCYQILTRKQLCMGSWVGGHLKICVVMSWDLCFRLRFFLSEEPIPSVEQN